MAACSPFQDVSSGKPLFMAVYVTVFAGVLFSTLFIVSSLYSASNSDNKKSQFTVGSWLSPSSSLPRPQVDVIGLRNQSTSVNISSDATVENFLTRAIWDLPSPDSKIPDLASFRLTREMVKYRAKDNVIIVTFGNYAFMDFILNWVRHLTDLNVFNLLVGSMDTKLLVALYWKGVPVFDMGSNMNTIDVGWGSPTFHKMGREKVFLINALLPFGYELLVCDTDMVWLKNPLPYLARFPEADLLTSSDQVIPTVTDDSLEVWQQVSSVPFCLIWTHFGSISVTLHRWFSQHYKMY
ncbi:hypothetical protein KFK09_028373 [Dendrobium nobile]|uniref:Nucleotide-diphospho-sugar transferase domain-containing protein n=1 Tax=Dendrobium nobile TaxID=94219 RepID=A0A8T3A2Y2_DENNO|nr:hypothetical protein KFK09_028373 [Dendrobium nobile]